VNAGILIYDPSTGFVLMGLLASCLLGFGFPPVQQFTSV